MKDCKRQERAVPLLPADERPARPAHRPGRSTSSRTRARGPAGFFGMIAHIDKRFGDLTKFLDRREARGQHHRHLHDRQRRHGRGEDLQRRPARRQDDVLRGRPSRPVLDPLARRQARRAPRHRHPDAEHRPAADPVRPVRRRAARSGTGATPCTPASASAALLRRARSRSARPQVRRAVRAGPQEVRLRASSGASGGW